ncbi:unnamed protein product [Cylicocyclus nassatus]|uniref:F-box domain-containing protein n=1 Tax=Cylicocyclus nassatus TaxID=53992 RepID=A0AA36GN44_CYLNA|nr:unnamed protein product [Cylicocyclus nassatus]
MYMTDGTFAKNDLHGNPRGTLPNSATYSPPPQSVYCTFASERMPMRLRSDKIVGDLVRNNDTSTKLRRKRVPRVPFPFFELPPELCVRILRHVRKVESTRSRAWECRCFREIRLVCRAMNDIIEENRATIGPMQVQRLFIGQHQAFDQGPKRFVVQDASELPSHLSSCAHSYLQQAFFYKVSLKTPMVEHLIRKLRENRVHIRGMIFYGAVFDCDRDVLVDLFETSRTACLIMLECQLPDNLAEFLARHEFIATMKSHFIGSFDSFQYYHATIIASQDDEWLKWFIELTLPSVTPPDPFENEYVWRILWIRHEPLKSVALNMDYCIYVFMFDSGVVSYFESFSLESSYR